MNSCLIILMHLNANFHPFLAAFRKGLGCQSILLRLLEDWRKALDNQQCVGAILMDLSKAFNCLPHRLLIANVTGYRYIYTCTALLYKPAFMATR